MNKKGWYEIYRKGSGIKQHLGSLYTHSLLLDEICKCGAKNILEVGTGSGIMSTFLSLMGYEVLAVDNDPLVLDAARELSMRFGSKVEHIQADALKLGHILAGRRFDLAFSQGLFEHFDDEEIKRMVKGQLELSEIVFISVPSVYYPVKEFGNERLMGCGEWRRILSPFNVEELRYYGIFLPGRKDIFSSLLNPAFHFKVAFSLFTKGSSHILIKIRA